MGVLTIEQTNSSVIF